LRTTPTSIFTKRAEEAARRSSESCRKAYKPAFVQLAAPRSGALEDCVIERDETFQAKPYQ
jgi:hypothetical protein